MTKAIKFPNNWYLTDMQDAVIGSLADTPGEYMSAYEFCQMLYDDDEAEATMPAPAKLRVTIQRCREILKDHTDGMCRIDSKRGSGWYMTRKSLAFLRKAVDLD